MSTQKTLFDIFEPSTPKPSQTSPIGQKRKSDADPQEVSASKKRVFKRDMLLRMMKVYSMLMKQEIHFSSSSTF